MGSLGGGEIGVSLYRQVKPSSPAAGHGWIGGRQTADPAPVSQGRPARSHRAAAQSLVMPEVKALARIGLQVVRLVLGIVQRDAALPALSCVRRWSGHHAAARLRHRRHVQRQRTSRTRQCTVRRAALRRRSGRAVRADVRRPDPTVPSGCRSGARSRSPASCAGGAPMPAAGPCAGHFIASRRRRGRSLRATCGGTGAHRRRSAC